MRKLFIVYDNGYDEIIECVDVAYDGQCLLIVKCESLSDDAIRMDGIVYFRFLNDDE